VRNIFFKRGWLLLVPGFSFLSIENEWLPMHPNKFPYSGMKMLSHTIKTNERDISYDIQHYTQQHTEVA